ncbi:MAG: HD-GYP domain-containing protein [bacterium]|jgi:hypothetical protein|nr:hypothetical protein [Betaproteobacteria bacterium]
MAQNVPVAASARPERARLEPGDLEPGAPLPLDIFDRSGTKLLGRGQFVRDLAQLERLLEIGLWGEADAVQSLRGGRVAPHAAAAAAPLQFRAVSAFDELRVLRTDLHALLGGPGDALAVDGGFAASVRAMAARLMHAVELDPDAAIATIAWLRDRPYAPRQAVNVAVVTDLLLAQAGVEATARASAVCAALTMNLSIHALQDTLYDVKTPDAAQQALLRDHPRRSAEWLAATGVEDRAWLDAVQQHHQAADGSDHPAGPAGTKSGLAARAIAIADRFCTVVSERAYRSALPASLALKKMTGGGNPALDLEMAHLLARVMGAWPPGTVVMLRSAELAVVTHRTANPRGPIARAVRTRDGIASKSFPKRSTLGDTFAIVEESGCERLPPGLDVASLWKAAIEAAPA